MKKNKFKYIFLLFLIFIFKPIAMAQMTKLEKIEPKLDEAYVLKGKVEHSRKLSPLSGEFKIGRRIDAEKLLKQIAPQACWFWIPKWRAGTFNRQTQVDFTAKGPIEYKSEVESFWGYQSDCHSEIWQYTYYPSLGSVRTDGYEELKLYEVIKPIEVNPNEVVLYFKSINIDVSEKTIIKCNIQEDIETYTPDKLNRVLCHSSSAYYTSDGVYTNVVEGQSVENLIKPYAAVNNYNGLNIYESFKNFLESKGWSYLLPK